MKVLTAPSKLRYAAAMIFVCVPLAALETIIVARAPWWRLPTQSILTWATTVFAISCPLFYWFRQGKRWALTIAAAFFFVWTLLGIWVSLRMRYPALAFFTILSGMVFGALWVWLRAELSRSYFDPKMNWYQGEPRAIPGLSCEIQKQAFRVSRFDKEGAFVFNGPASEPPISWSPKKNFELGFVFRERQIRCQGHAVRVLGDGQGAGLQFQGLSPDSRKELGDFFEILRGEGYVE